MADVIFSFDPACDWTWRASRWLTEVAGRRGLDIDWQPFSFVVHYGADMPEDYRPMLEASHGALRLVEALRADGRSADVARFYTELGTAVHERGEQLTSDLVSDTAKASGVADQLDAVDDASWDAAVRESHDSAFASVGPDVGCPMIQLAGVERGLYGPVITEVPTGDDAIALWEAMTTLLRFPWFYELKRGRR
jgi:2-hydroxychromene-2-carboxylate isomerase